MIGSLARCRDLGATLAHRRSSANSLGTQIGGTAENARRAGDPGANRAHSRRWAKSFGTQFLIDLVGNAYHDAPTDALPVVPGSAAHTANLTRRLPPNLLGGEVPGGSLAPELLGVAGQRRSTPGRTQSISYSRLAAISEVLPETS